MKFSKLVYRNLFRNKLRAEMQRHAVVTAVESGNMDFVLLDVRTRAQFDAGHIPGAWCAPLDELTKVTPVLPRDRLIVTYCNGFD